MSENYAPRIRLLGRPSLELDGARLALPEKAYFLFSLLALAPDTTLDRETIRRLLWPSDDSEKRANSLRQLLARVAKAVGPLAPAILVSDGEALQLDTTRIGIDVVALKQA